MLIDLLTRGLKNARNFVLMWLLLSPFTASAGDPTVSFAPDDPEMETAISQARGSIMGFFGIMFGDNDVAHPAGSLKVAFPVEHEAMSREHIWVSEIERAGCDFTARLANEPVAMDGVTLGSEVSFDSSMISDWGINADGQLLGHYTTRVVISRLPAAQRQQYAAMLEGQSVTKNWPEFAAKSTARCPGLS